MLYMLSLHWNPEMSPVSGETALEFHLEFARETREKGKYIISEALAGPDTATTLRLSAGTAFKTDGPFIETKEALAGLYILDFGSDSEAAEYAERLLLGSGLQAIEIRPITYLPGWNYEIAADRERRSVEG